MLKLATEEGNNIEWLSVKYILLWKLLSFGIIDIFDVLPSWDNLK